MKSKRGFLCLRDKSGSRGHYYNNSFDSDDVLPPNYTELDKPRSMTKFYNAAGDATSVHKERELTLVIPSMHLLLSSFGILDD